MRRIMACTRATVSTTWSATHRTVPMSLDYQQLVVAGIGVGDAGTAGRHVDQSILVERLQEGQDRAWPGHILRLDVELVAGSKLPAAI